MTHPRSAFGAPPRGGDPSSRAEPVRGVRSMTPVRPAQATPSLGASLPALHAPRISVLVCNFNYAHYIAQTLDSVLAQTLAAHEILVVDDGSTDSSVAVVQGYADRGVRLVVQPNGGQTAAYNTALLHASGDVLLFVDSDDALLPGALAEVAGRFTAGVAKVHFRLALIGPDGALLGGSIPHQLAVGEVATRLLRHGVPHASPPASGNAYRRSVLAPLFPLPLDASDRHGADFFCIYGSALFGDVAACPQALGLYRLHRVEPQLDSLTFGNAAKGQVLEERTQARMARFSAWITERSAGAVRPPRHMLDFSVEKTAYATAVLFGAPQQGRLRRAGARLPTLLRAIWWRAGDRPWHKLGLVGWALLVLVAPRPLALRAARFVCDPASRSAAVDIARPAVP